jgi:Xaa-Pro aminopeptidase
MRQAGVQALCLSVGPDLPYLTGYTAVRCERGTVLVVPVARDAVLVVPELEAPRVTEQAGVFSVRPWTETENPVQVVADLVGRARVVAVGDQTWARFLLALEAALPDARFLPANRVTGPLRIVKDVAEIESLQRAAAVVDGIATAMRARPFAGRTERDISREFVDRMLDGGHERANFAIVAAGPNGASPHHDAGNRVLEAGDVVVCDFGGSLDGYCSDITRVYVVGEPSAEVRDCYEHLVAAQEGAFRAATVGTTCEAVDATARRVLADAGLDQFFVHRTGHGIGVEAHEDPYLVAGNADPLEPGHVFSIEPGVYLPGRFGLRLEDIVVATEDDPRRLNAAPRDLAVVA